MAQFSDTFSGSGSLSTTEIGGAAWQVLAGTWSRNGGYAYTGTSPSSNPLAVIDAATGDVDISLNVSYLGGDALYFRVQDASNWWRAKIRRYQSTSTTYTTEYEWRQNYNCPSLYSQYWSNPYESRTGWGSFSSPPSFPSSVYHDGHYGYTGYPGYTGGTPDPIADQYGHTHYDSGSPFKTGSTRSVASGTTTNTYYYVVLERCVAGSISQVRNYSVGTTSSLRVVASGTSISLYTDGVQQSGVTDATFATATRHGIGKGYSELTSSAIDNFSLITLNVAPNTPVLTSPGSNVRHDVVNRFAWQFSDPDVGDTQSSFSLRYRPSGGATWTTVNQSTANNYWDAPANTFARDVDYEWQLLAYDNANMASPWSALGYFTTSITLGSVVVGGVKKPVVEMSVIVGGIKKPLSSVAVIEGGAKRPLGP